MKKVEFKVPLDSEGKIIETLLNKIESLEERVASLEGKTIEPKVTKEPQDDPLIAPWEQEGLSKKEWMNK